jgi:hypothetical protein
MADFKYVKQISGATTESLVIMLTGTVEAGDFVTYARDKADATDAELGFFALEGGDDGDEILVLPVVAGMVFQGDADADIAEKGTQVGLAVDTATQVIDASGADNLFFVALDAVDESEDATCRVMYTGAYHVDNDTT